MHMQQECKQRPATLQYMQLYIITVVFYCHFHKDIQAPPSDKHPTLKLQNYISAGGA